MSRAFSLAAIVFGLSLVLPAAAQPATKGGPGSSVGAGSEGRRPADKNHRAERRKERKEERLDKREARTERHEELAEAKDPPAERSAADQARDAARAKRLLSRAKRFRDSGNEQVARSLEKRAERVAKGQDVRNDKVAWKKQRQARKLIRLKQLQKKYGKDLEQESVREELRRHARVTARLGRLRELAEEKDDDALVDRIEKLRRMEQAKHDKIMARLMGKTSAKGAKDPDQKPTDGNEPNKENK